MTGLNRVFERELGEGLESVSLFGDVVRFQRVLGLKVGEGAGLLSSEDWGRRLRLILEELSETVTAHEKGDLEGFLDGLVDLVWVTLGSAVEAGLPFDEAWGEVRRVNMAKAGGVLDAGGKLQKPVGWCPPDIRGVLERAGVVE